MNNMIGKMLDNRYELLAPLDEDERKTLSALLRQLLLPFEGTPVRPLR